jgi:nicotinamidase-related amidase
MQPFTPQNTALLLIDHQVGTTGKKNLIMAGVTTDVCLIFPAIDAAKEGYGVQAVIDASFSSATSFPPSGRGCSKGPGPLCQHD